MPNNWYTKPDDVVGVLIDPFSGELATNRTKKKKILYYVKGTEPTYNNKPLESLIELP